MKPRKPKRAVAGWDGNRLGTAVRIEYRKPGGRRRYVHEFPSGAPLLTTDDGRFLVIPVARVTDEIEG